MTTLTSDPPAAAAPGFLTLSRDPAVRNHLFAGFAALVVLFAAMFQRNSEAGAAFVALVGAAGLVLRRAVAPPVLIAAVSFFAVFPTGVPDLASTNPFAIREGHFRFGDLVLGGAVAVYLFAQYRVLAIGDRLFPPETVTRRGRPADPPYRRPAATVAADEPTRMLYVAAAAVVGGQVAWFLATAFVVDPGDGWVPIRAAELSRPTAGRRGGTPPALSRFLLLAGGLFFGWLVASRVAWAWRLRRLSRDEAGMVLLDAGWDENRRELGRQASWRAWAYGKFKGQKSKLKDEDRSSSGLHL